MDPERRLRDGRYVLRGLLGEGSQGTTHDAVDLREGRPVAVKRFDVRGARSWKDVELAEREARVLATLEHPLLPRYVEHFEEDGVLYLVMEKIEGETLDAMRRRGGTVAEAEVVRFLACAADALGYLHGRSPSVVHRDVKPRNVIRRPDGTFAFVDFGAVAERMKPRGGSTVVGTLGYMAPEQLQGRALPATDVYAVGATALSVLSGAEPETLPHRGLRVDVRRALGGRVSEDLVAALERMLEPDPDVRPSSIGPLLRRLRGPDPPREKARKERALTRAERADAKRRRRDEATAEDRAVKSITSLLWVLWGLGWTIVIPLTHRPVIMFVWLAVVIAVTWHKGAVIRAALREIERARAHRPRVAEPLAGAEPEVRVVASPEHEEPEEEELDEVPEERQRRRR